MNVAVASTFETSNEVWFPYFSMHKGGLLRTFLFLLFNLLNFEVSTHCNSEVEYCYLLLFQVLCCMALTQLWSLISLMYHKIVPLWLHPSEHVTLCADANHLLFCFCIQLQAVWNKMHGALVYGETKSCLAVQFKCYVIFLSWEVRAQLEIKVTVNADDL